MKKYIVILFSLLAVALRAESAGDAIRAADSLLGGSMDVGKYKLKEDEHHAAKIQQIESWRGNARWVALGVQPMAPYGQRFLVQYVKAGLESDYNDTRLELVIEFLASGEFSLKSFGKLNDVRENR